MSDINVTAHGINPETGEYLSPAERKALFKKGRMGSKIDPSSFKSGVISGVKAAEKVRKKAESENKDFVDLEREMNKLNDQAAGGGGSGGGTSALVPFSGVFGSALSTEVKDLEPPVEKVRVNVDDASPEQAEESKETFKDALKKLLESLKRITKLKSRQRKASKKTDNLRGKQKHKKKKERKTSGRDIFGVGRKIKGKVTKTMGDIFGIFGDIIAFGILSWIGDPKNKKMVKGLVQFLGHAFKFINFFVGAFVDNALTGLSQLLGPDRSMGERFIGALRLISGFFLLRWIRKPWKVVGDIKNITKIFSKFSKFVNKILKKPIQFIQNFVQKALNKTLGKVFKSALFKPLKRFIIQVGGKSLVKLLGAVGRGFVKIISRVPFIGALLEFFMDVFLFKKPPMRSAFKAIGGALLGAVGMLGGPIGAIIGGWVGSEAGGWLYDAWFGQGHDADKQTEDQEESDQSSGNDSNASQNRTPDQNRTSGDLSFSLEIGKDEKAALAVLAKYESGAAGYNAVNQGGSNNGRGVLGYSGDITRAEFNPDGIPLTEMTIGEIKARQAEESPRQSWDQWFAAGKLHAVGRYQFVGNTLPGVAARAGFSDNMKFDKTVQDKMAIQLIKERGISPWVGPSDKATPAERALVRKVQNSGRGGGYGMLSPRKSPDTIRKSPAKMRKIPLKNSSMPSMSESFSIDEKMKSNGAMEQPIIINNIQENSIGLSISTLTLNNKKKSVNQVLSRL